MLLALECIHKNYYYYYHSSKWAFYNATTVSMQLNHSGREREKHNILYI